MPISCQLTINNMNNHEKRLLVDAEHINVYKFPEYVPTTSMEKAYVASYPYPLIHFLWENV